MEEKICMVSTVKAPKQQIIDFVNYHLNIGIDHIFLFFDERNKSKFSFLKPYKKVSCFLTPKEKLEKIEDLQRKNTDKGLNLARKKGFDWIIHLDSDELIYLKGRIKLKKFLSRIPKKIDYIRLPTIEATPEKPKYKYVFREINLFKNNFWKLSKKFFRGHICGKAIVRVNSSVKSLDLHLPAPHKKLKVKFILFRARLMHFNRCDYSIWKSSWITKISKNCKNHEGGKKYCQMIKEFEKIYEKKDKMSLVNLYKKQFFVPEKTKKILLLLGIMKRIKLNKKLFEKPRE